MNSSSCVFRLNQRRNREVKKKYQNLWPSCSGEHIFMVRASIEMTTDTIYVGLGLESSERIFHINTHTK